MYTHAYIYIYIYIYTHTYTYIYIYVLEEVLQDGLVLLLVALHELLDRSNRSISVTK